MQFRDFDIFVPQVHSGAMFITSPYTNTVNSTRENRLIRLLFLRTFLGIPQIDSIRQCSPDIYPKAQNQPGNCIHHIYDTGLYIILHTYQKKTNILVLPRRELNNNFSRCTSDRLNSVVLPRYLSDGPTSALQLAHHTYDTGIIYHTSKYY